MSVTEDPQVKALLEKLGATLATVREATKLDLSKKGLGPPDALPLSRLLSTSCSRLVELMCGCQP